MRRAIRAHLSFNFDPNASVVVEKATFERRPVVLIHVNPGGNSAGDQVTVFLVPARAVELGRQLQKAGNGR